MADLDGSSQCASEEDLIQRHKQERKSLQADIQKLKHSVTKGDRKKKKEINEKIAVLEADLDAKHEKELAEFKINGPTVIDTSTSEAAICDGLKQLTTQERAGDTENVEVKSKKTSKAQKRRDKKAAKDQEREERIKEQDIDNLTSSRHLEEVKIKQILNQRGLQIHRIPSDGNCLYAAVTQQIGTQDIKLSVESLRQQVAGYMRTHQDDFIPFLTKDNGDCYTPDDFEEYCKQTESTPAWGGQLEIQALSHILSLPIEVIQSDSPPILTGEEHKAKPVTLTYHRHAYGLGEHYNTVEDKVEEPEDEFT